MKKNSNWLWGFCLIGLFASGCSSSQNIVRGQNAAEPHTPGPAYAHPVGTTYSNHLADGWTPGANHHSYGYTADDSGNCDECNECKSGHCNKGHKHAHRHFYHYSAPKDLVYPQQNQPAAVVQYPYYTVKGPDDFFHK
jgi:hypothetical protein